jgi:hypothetical protein
VVGHLTISRMYFSCFACGLSDTPLDQRLGLEEFLSPGARRMTCLAGATHAYAAAEKLLSEMLGWTLSDEAIRQICQGEAKAMSEWRESAPAAVSEFQEAIGAIEFQTDAAKVNTTEGWRDMKIGIFAKRPAGKPATAAEWDRRVLPAPTARHAFAAIEAIEVFGPRWSIVAENLGIDEFATVSVLGDGAEWIWHQAAASFPGSTGLLDIYHASEHLSDTAKQLYGDGDPRTKEWTESARMALLKDGWFGICEYLGQTLSDPTLETKRPAVDELTNYLSKHTDHLNYAHRLHTGRSIGSGMVEGAAKNLVGKRLKQTGARWRVDRVNAMAELCCLIYSNDWDAYWVTAA